MGLYKRGKTYWFTITRDGKRVQLSADTENKKMAEERYAKTLTSVSEGKWFTEVKQREYIFSELAEEYKKMYCRQLGFKGKDGYIRLLCRKFGDLKLSQFTTMIIEGYQTSLLAKGNKPSTVNRHISTVKHMFGKAYDWQMVSETVLKYIRRVKMLKENNKRLRYLSREEGQGLIDNCPEYRYA